MKTKLIIILIFAFLNGNSQELSKSQFQVIEKGIGKLLYYIKNSNSQEVDKILNLNNLDNFNDLQTIFNDSNIKLNDKTNNYFVFPHFKTTENSDQFLLTIIALKLIPKKKTGWQFGKYYFVIQSDIKYNLSENNFQYLNQRILTKNDSINTWWLKVFKSYNQDTKIIHDKYGFVPPPPPCIPDGLK